MSVTPAAGDHPTCVDTGSAGDALGTGSAGDHPARGDSDPVVLRAGREARLAGWLRAWWCDERPAWTQVSWWDARLAEPVRRVLWLAPGPGLVEALAGLPAGGPCTLDHTEDGYRGFPVPGRAPGWPCACQVVLAAAWDACASWLATRAGGALVAAAGAVEVSVEVGPGQRITDPAREELAHALRSSIASMGTRIAHARALHAHPGLVALVESAAISAWAARLVVDHLADLDPEQAGQVITHLTQRIQTRADTARRPLNAAEISQAARAARLRICPETAHQARVRAFTGRRVTVRPDRNGMATLIADLSDVEAHRIHRRLSAIATALHTDTPTDPRTRDQLRADILTDLLLGTPHPTDPTQHADPGAVTPTGPATSPPVDTDPTPGPTPAPAAAGAPPPGAPVRVRAADVQVQVIVSLDTLLGLSADPAHIPGLGPIPADIARALAADSRWRAWITDATGTVTATSTHTYTPTTALARLVRAREPHCRFPGCRQPAHRCDLDHTQPWPHGTTCATNLGPLCRRHHNLKTHTPWTLTPTPPPAHAEPPPPDPSAGNGAHPPDSPSPTAPNHPCPGRATPAQPPHSLPS